MTDKILVTNVTDEQEEVVFDSSNENKHDHFSLDKVVDTNNNKNAPFSAFQPLQQDVMFQVQMCNIIAKQGDPLMLYERIMSLMN